MMYENDDDDDDDAFDEPFEDNCEEVGVVKFVVKYWMPTLQSQEICLSF